MTAPAGDKQRAFQGEALLHADLLYNYALRMTNNVADAEDLLQEIFLTAYRFWDSDERGTNIRVWLFRMMKSSSTNRYWKEVRQPETAEYDEHTGAHALTKDDSEPRDAEQAIFSNLHDDEIQSAVASLPAEFRTVVILCDLEGMTYEEAADVMECPPGTVGSRLHRGRKLLRDALESYARSSGVVPGK
jgi:RNA polymerase sigma-70 factor (ECF subfamily)